MPTTLFSEFHPYVEPFVPGCPTATIDEHLAEAARKFCEKTYLWRYDVAEVTMTINEPNYTISVPADTELEDFLVLEVNESKISRVIDSSAEPSHSDDPGLPAWYAIFQNTTVRFYPPPSEAHTFRGTAILKPTLTATGLESFLFESHGRCIANGALSKLTAIPNRSWTDPENSAMYDRMFVSACATARIRDARSTARSVAMRPLA